MVSEMCEVYHCTPRQLREDFSVWERQTFWHIQQMKRAKAEQDEARSKPEHEGKLVIPRA